VEIQQTVTVQRELGGEPVRRELCDTGKEEVKKDPVEMPP